MPLKIQLSLGGQIVEEVESSKAKLKIGTRQMTFQ